MGHKDIQTTQHHADYCPNPGEREVVEAAFARGTHSGTNLRTPVRNGAQPTSGLHPTSTPAAGFESHPRSS